MKKITGLFIAILVFILITALAWAGPVTTRPKSEGFTSVTITWDDATTSAAADIEPDTDTVVNVFRASTITLSCSTLTADDIGGTSNLSTNVDVDVIASADCSNYDVVTAPYAADKISNMNDNQQETASVTVGPRCIKLRADNDAGGTLDLTCRVLATWD